MTPISKEIIHQVQNEFDDLLNFVLLDTRSSQAYEVERAIWRRLLQIGYSLMRAWFQMRCHQYGQTPLVGDDGEETPFLTQKTRTFYCFDTLVKTMGFSPRLLVRCGLRTCPEQ